jgi:hypothetical protein
MGNGGSSPSARWAPDPSGRHAFRYWDGERWTGHVADGVFAPARAPEPTDTPGTPLPTSRAPETESPSAGDTPVVDPVVDPAAEDAAETAVGTEAAEEVAEEHHESRRQERRQAARRRKTFWLGALTGAAVVLIAVAAAAVALNVKINPSTTSAKRHTTTSTTVAPTTLATTTTTLNPGRPPQQVRVEVINASGAQNAAGLKALALGRLGYAGAGLADAPVRQGTAVQCKPGFEAEAVTLSKAVGAGTTVEPFPNPPPQGSANADCVVILGK